MRRPGTVILERSEESGWAGFPDRHCEAPFLLRGNLLLGIGCPSIDSVSFDIVMLEFAVDERSIWGGGALLWFLPFKRDVSS
jgi:hypothetical protein